MDWLFFCPGKRGATGSIASSRGEVENFSRGSITVTCINGGKFRAVVGRCNYGHCASTSFEMNILRIRIPSISFQIFENNSKVETNIFSRFTLNRSELEQLRTE